MTPDTPTPYSTVKWGNPKFAKLDPTREPTPADIMMLLLEYRRCGHVDTAAKRVNLDYATAHKAIYAAIEKEPTILDDPQLFLSTGLMLREIAMEAGLAAKDKMRSERLRPNDLVYTMKIALEKSQSLFAEYRDAIGAEASGSTDEMDAAIAEKEREIARLKGTDTSEGAAETEDAAGPTGVPETVDADS